jgi:hypothetical protein
MNKKAITMIIILTLIFSMTVSASPKDKDDLRMTVYPETETTINGIPESQIINSRVLFPWIFDYYDPDNNSVKQKFKEISQVHISV